MLKIYWYFKVYYGIFLVCAEALSNKYITSSLDETQWDSVSEAIIAPDPQLYPCWLPAFADD